MNARRTAALILAAAALMTLNAGAYAENAPDIAAGGAALIEQHTSAVICAKEAHKKLPMASTTKIMTALIVIENCSLGDTVKVSPKAYGVEGSSMYLNAGEEVSVEDMLYGLMLLSGNDAAVALAIHTAGSVEAFAALMNARAEEIGAHNTNFVTPNGLHDPEHYTTAYDLALIAAEAMKNPDFRKIVGSTYHKTTTGSVIRYMKNKNKILWQYEGGCGVKTGFTKAAGRCLVFAAERDGMTLIGAVLSCPDMFNVAKAMLDYGFASFRTEKIISAGQSITRIRVSGGTKTALAAEAKDDIIIPVRIGESADIRTEVETRSGMNAPVEKGDAVCNPNRLVYNKKADVNVCFFVETVYSVAEANSFAHCTSNALISTNSDSLKEESLHEYHPLSFSIQATNPEGFVSKSTYPINSGLRISFISAQYCSLVSPYLSSVFALSQSDILE